MKTKLALALLLLCAANAKAEDYRVKNQATTIPIEYRNATTGAWITGATGSDCECGYFTDGATPAVATFADCTNEATEFDTSSGRYYLQLSASEMNHDFVLVKCHSTSSGAVDYSATISTLGRAIPSGGIPADGVAARGTLQSASSTGAVLASAENWANNALIGYVLYINSATTSGAGAWGCITGNLQSSDAVTVKWANGKYPTGTTITYDLFPEKACNANIEPTKN